MTKKEFEAVKKVVACNEERKMLEFLQLRHGGDNHDDEKTTI